MALKENMIMAMIKELCLINRNDVEFNLTGQIIETIYFGGGTPSLINVDDLERLIKKVKEMYTISQNIEITLEANPDDINEVILQRWRSVGINRLSIGMQSLNNHDLNWMNRAHNTTQSIHSIELVKNAGYNNYSIDLIYGLPNHDDLGWKLEIENIIKLNVPHIACYALTVEPGTALHKMISLKKRDNVNNETQADQFIFLMEKMESAGYEHYEISNFAKPGYRSKHNSSYWKGCHYLGIGPSAHSYNGKKRKWNISNNPLYIKNIEKDNLPYDQELLNEKELFNEFIMISLRTSEGIDLIELQKRFGTDRRLKVEKGITKYVEMNKTIILKSKLQLTKEGKLFADAIASDLFL